MTDYSTLTFNGVISEADGSKPDRAKLCIWSAIGTYINDNIVASIVSPVNGIATMDISSLNGSYYIGVGLHHTGSYVNVKRIELRK